MATSQFQIGRPQHPILESSAAVSPQDAHEIAGFISNPAIAAIHFVLYAMYLGIVVDGLFPQLAIALLGGRDPYVQPLAKIALPIACIVLWLIKGQLDLHAAGWSGILFLLYLLLDTTYFGLTSNSFPDAALGLYVGYFTFFMVLLLSALDTALSEQAIARILIVAFVVNLLIELAQSIANAPLLPLESIDGNFAVTSFQFYGNIRAFGLFGSISAAGSFGSLIAALAIGSWKQRWSTFTVTAVCAAALLMVYVVRLRLGFIELAFCSVAAVLLRFFPQARSIILLPLIQLGVMLLVLIGLSTSLGHSTGLFDASSLLDRLGEWRDALGALSNFSITKILFGTGMIQHRLTISQDNGTWLDSMYLEVILHIGIVGLSLLLVYYAWLYRYAVRWVQKTSSPLAIAVTATWSSLPALGVINLMYANVSTYLIGLLLCVGAPLAASSLNREIS